MYLKLTAVFVLLMPLGLESTKMWVDLPKIEKYLQNQTSAIVLPKQQLVIHLAIFCDQNFAHLFNYDQKKIVHYWKTVMYDMHLRFQTLPSLNISFRVTTLQTLKINELQKFVDIDKDGNYSMKQIADKFEFWSYGQIQKIPKFDIAVLVLGFPIPDVHGLANYTRHNSICSKLDDKKKRWQTNIIVNMQEHPTGALTKNIAYVLGAKDDNHPICNGTVNTAYHCCVMGGRIHEEIEPHHFSNCTDRVLAARFAKLVAKKPSCLSVTSAASTSIINSEYLFRNPSKVPSYTVEEQCKLLVNDKNATINFGSCMFGSCLSNSRKMFVAFAPLAGTPCGKNGQWRCLRNYCIETEVQLVNVGTGKCLVPEESQFAIFDKPVLRDCSEIPMDLMFGTNIWYFGFTTITMMYSTNDGPGFKHLKMVDDPNQGLVARFDPDVNDITTSWIIQRLKKYKSEEFALVHMVNLKVAVAAEDGTNIEFRDHAFVLEDPMARWKFVRVNGTDAGFSSIYSQFYKFRYFVTEYLYWVKYVIFLVFLAFCYYLIKWWNRKRTSWGEKENKKNQVIAHFAVGKKIKCKKVKTK